MAGDAARRRAGRIDPAFGALLPGLMVADAWAYQALFPGFKASLESMLIVVMFVPILAVAPLVAARWIRSTGLRTPGEALAGLPRRPPIGSVPRNVGLALGWMLASAPFGFLQLDMSRHLVGWFFVLVVPVGLWWSVVAGLRASRTSSEPELA